MKNHYFEKEAFERFLIRKKYHVRPNSIKVRGRYIQCVLEDEDVVIWDFNIITKKDDGIHVELELANIPKM